MELNQIAKTQIALDEANGFPVKFTDSVKRYDQLTKDLVGLFGEVGEFSNIVKKINIKLARPNEYELDIPTAEVALREELIDALIYVIRIGAILDVDLEAELLKKIQINATRYAPLRRD